MIRLSILCLALVAAMLCIPAAGAPARDDGFLSGYVSAVLEREYHHAPATLSVQDGVVRLRIDDLSDDDKARIEAGLRGIDGVRDVIWLESGQVLTERDFDRLFPPLLADPRWPHFSASYQRYLDTDGNQLRNVAATSFGEMLVLHRGDAFWDGEWEFGPQAAVFAIFDMDAVSHDLVNADYFVALTSVYRKHDVSALMRLFHQSSHLGDEFLLRSRVDRVNLSYEALDLLFSWEATGWLRVYGGGGYLFDQEPADLDPWFWQYGVELSSAEAYFDDRLRPVLGVDVQQKEELDYRLDVSVRAGVQIETRRTVGHRVQLLLEYYQGHSPNGQFFDDAIEFWGLGLHFYF